MLPSGVPFIEENTTNLRNVRVTSDEPKNDIETNPIANSLNNIRVHQKDQEKKR